MIKIVTVITVNFPFTHSPPYSELKKKKKSLNFQGTKFSSYPNNNFSSYKLPKHPAFQVLHENTITGTKHACLFENLE